MWKKSVILIGDRYPRYLCAIIQHGGQLGSSILSLCFSAGICTISELPEYGDVLGQCVLSEVLGQCVLSGVLGQCVLSDVLGQCVLSGVL